MNNLRIVLRLNAASCIIFGVLFFFVPATIDAFIGNAIPVLVKITGGLLCLNGVHLIFASYRATLIPLEIRYFVLGDALWVVLTVVLIVSGAVITTVPGMAAAAIIAVIVGALGYRQHQLISSSSSATG